jgi:hypothetical protein
LGGSEGVVVSAGDVGLGIFVECVLEDGALFLGQSVEGVLCLLFLDAGAKKKGKKEK